MPSQALNVCAFVCDAIVDRWWHSHTCFDPAGITSNTITTTQTQASSYPYQQRRCRSLWYVYRSPEYVNSFTLFFCRFAATPEMFSLGEKQVFYYVLDKDFCDIVVLFISGLYSNRISLFEQNCTLIRNKDYENINYMSQVWFPIEQRFIVSILNRYIIFIINYSDDYCETTNIKTYIFIIHAVYYSRF